MELNAFKSWSWRRDLNPRPSDYKAGKLRFDGLLGSRIEHDGCCVFSDMAACPFVSSAILR